MEQHQGGGSVPPTKPQEEPSYEQEQYSAPVATGGFTENKMLAEVASASGGLSNRCPQQVTMALPNIRSDMVLDDASRSRSRVARAKDPLWEICRRKPVFKRSVKISEYRGDIRRSLLSESKMKQDDGSKEDKMITSEVGGSAASVDKSNPGGVEELTAAQEEVRVSGRRVRKMLKLPSGTFQKTSPLRRRRQHPVTATPLQKDPIASSVHILHSKGSPDPEADSETYNPHVLQTTLRRIYSHIKLAEYWVHKDAVANLLREAKDAAYCAVDLLDELNYYKLIQHEVEENANQFIYPDFSDINMTDIHGKLNHLIEQMEDLNLHVQEQDQDKFIFESSSQKWNHVKGLGERLYGRLAEFEALIYLLVEHNPTGRQATGAADMPTGDRATPQVLSVLPIVGDGGIGKTALAHSLFNDSKVKNHYNLLVWICVSDGFDEKELIKRIACSATESEMESDGSSCLQRYLTNGIIHQSRRLLLVLDDLQDDVCQEHYRGWERLLAPLKYARPGSMILVTTRSLEVADHICTMDPFQLEGLTENYFWPFFSMLQVEFDVPISGLSVTREIAGRLHGSPLGAKIIGYLLNLKWDARYWKGILESELWKLGHHKEVRIWPALQLSYQYLPFHLKRCFSFCAMYPKGHEFDAETLVDNWTAVRLVERRVSMLAVDIGHECFNHLVMRSFFQISPTSSSCAYVMQGLLYDMAQHISISECFVIKDNRDLSRIPPKVRHMSILSFSGLSSRDLESLYKYSTLWSVVCIGIDSDVLTTSVLETWFCHLTNIRMLRFISCRLKELPGNVGNLILLRYLDISSCDFESLPDSFWRLYNLQTLYAQNCRFHGVPKEIIKLVNLRKVKLKGDLMNQLGCISGVGKLMFLQEMPCYAICDTPGRGIEELKNLNNLRGALEISGIHNVTSKEQAAEADLYSKIHLNTLVLSWHDSIRPDKHNSEQEMEVLEGLRPNPDIKCLEIRFYMGSGFHPSWLLNGWFPYDEKDLSSLFDFFPGHGASYNLESLSISSCPNLASLFITETGSSSSSRGSSQPQALFRSLTKLSIT